MRLLAPIGASLIAIAITLVTSRAGAQDRHVRAIVRIADDAIDRALARRIRGQTVDLPVELIEVTAAPLEPRDAERHRTAITLADREQARVVVWLEASRRGASRVVVADRATGQLLTRPVRDRERRDRSGGGAAFGSAALESAALIVRNALRSIVEGEPLPTTERLAPAPPPPREQPPARTSRRDRAPDGARDRVRARVAAALSWRITIDGSGEPLPGGPELDLGMSLGALELRLGGGATLPVEIRDDVAAVELTTYEGHLYTGARLALDSASSLVGRAGLRIGVVGYERETTAVSSGLVATEPQATWSFVAGPVLGGRWAVAAPIHLVVSLGLDVVLRAPLLVSRTESSQHELRALWTVQPWAALGLEVELP